MAHKCLVTKESTDSHTYLFTFPQISENSYFLIAISSDNNTRIIRMSATNITSKLISLENKMDLSQKSEGIISWEHVSLLFGSLVAEQFWSTLYANKNHKRENDQVFRSCNNHALWLINYLVHVPRQSSSFLKHPWQSIIPTKGSVLLSQASANIKEPRIYICLLFFTTPKCASLN